MFKNFFKKSEDDKNSKRQLENIVVFIIILIITVLIINNMWSKEDENKNDTTSSKVLAQTTSSDLNTSENLEKKLENILSSIDGVGKVKVLIKYSESSTIAMYNETSSESTTAENDAGGGSKNVKETESKKEVVYSDKNGKNEPITEKVVMPVIEGTIITAQGASNANTKSAIVSAVEAVTGLAVHKIQVFEMGGEVK